MKERRRVHGFATFTFTLVEFLLIQCATVTNKKSHLKVSIQQSETRWHIKTHITCYLMKDLQNSCCTNHFLKHQLNFTNETR